MTTARGRHPVLLLGALGLAVSLLALPFHLGSRDSKLALTAALVRAAGSESVTLGAPVTLLERPRIVLERGTIAVLAGASSASASSLGAGSLLKLLAQGRARLLIEDATFAIGPEEATTAEAGAAASTNDEPLTPILAALAQFSFESLTIRNATVVRQAAGGAVCELAVITAGVTFDSKSSVSAKGTLQRQGQQLTFETTVSLPTGKSGTRIPIKASLHGAMLNAEFSGQLARGKNLVLTASRSELRTPDLKLLAEWLGAGRLTGPGFQAFEAKGPFEWSGGDIEFQSARFVIDGNAASGTLSFNPGADRPSVDGTLDFAGLDLAPYSPRARSGGGIFALGATWLFPSTAAGGGTASLIDAVDADLRISAGRVSLGPVDLGKGAATLSVKHGRLNASITEIELAQGGQGEGRIAVDLRQPVPRYDIRGELRAFDTARAGMAVAGRPLIEGLATLSGHVTATGLTSHEWLASLDGQAELTLPDGGAVGLDLDALMTPPRAGTRGWASALGRTTAAEALTVRLAAKDGVLSTEAADIQAGRNRFTAAGTIDLRDHALDMTVTRLPAGADRTAGVPAARRQAVRIHGPLAAPEFASSPTGDRAETPPDRLLPPG